MDQFDSYIKVGDISSAKQYSENFRIKEPIDETITKLQKGILFRFDGDVTSAQNYSLEALDAFQQLTQLDQLQYSFIHARILYLQAKINHQMAKLEESNSLFELAGDFFRQSGNVDWEIASIQGIAINHRITGDYQESLKLLLEGLDYLEKQPFSSELEERKMGLKMNIALCYENLGDITRAVIEFEQALFSVYTSMEDVDDSYDLVELIRLHLKIGQMQRALKYQKQLERLANSETSIMTVNLNELSKALLYVHSPRLADKIKAKPLFEKLMDYQFFGIEYILLVRIHVFNLLLYEYRALENDEVVQQMHNLVSGMSQMAEKHHHYPLWIQSLILHSKLHFTIGELGEANLNLQSAIKLCQENGLHSLEAAVLEEINRVEQEISRLQILSQQGLAESSFLDRSGITEYLEEILKLQIHEKRTE